MSNTAPFSERRLDRAVQHVGTHWFPINQSVLSSLRKGLDEGAYELDITFLVNELKSDFALFTYCIKELIPIAARENVPMTVSSDPIKLIRWGGTRRIKGILGTDRTPPQSHSLTDAEMFLQERLKETSISASAVEVLSKSQNLDADTGFCHGVVRQIGLNLVAWNYPSLYARVIKSLTKSTTLDAELSKELGFSPSMLALRLLRPQPRREGVAVTPAEESWKAYDTLCEVGEALARANNPATYPNAEQDWSKAQGFITQAVGPDGVDLIKRRAIENTTVYRQALPGTFVALAHFDPETRIRDHRKGVRARENPYLKQCSPALQAALNSLYADMPQDSVNKHAIERLVKQIIPQAGFTGGCVFVVDPSAMTLVPRTGIGQVTLRKLTSIPLRTAPGSAMAPLIAETINTGSRPPTDLASAAFACDQPLIERSDVELSNSVAGIYCSLGKKRKIGVLYLEVPESELNSTDPQALKTFKALRQSLCDALLVE